MAAEPRDLLTGRAGGVLAELGERLRTRRHELERTMTSVAKEASVSVSYMSELESGASTPSLAVLVRLAHTLSLSLNELLRATSSSPIATGTLRTERPGATPMSADGLRLYVVSLVAGAGEAGEPPLPVAGSDLFVHIRAGMLRVIVDEQPYDLADGDSLDATRPASARWEVRGDDRCVSLWVTHRPERVRP